MLLPLASPPAQACDNLLCQLDRGGTPATPGENYLDRMAQDERWRQRLDDVDQRLRQIEQQRDRPTLTNPYSDVR